MELTSLLLPNDDGAPIPVPFELSAWTARQLPLEQFMGAELARQYGVGGSLAKHWVAAEEVIPMLDGLDEVPASHRAACVNCINAFRQAHPRVKLVVACREAEYGELRLGVDARSAVVVQTLDRPAVQDYLAKPEFFAGLRRALVAAPELWELMTTPLMLWVAAFAFEKDGAGDLRAAADLRAALFDRFIDRMLAREAGKRGEPAPAFSAEDTRRWLAETAAAMGRVGVTSFHLEDLSVDWLPEPKRSTANRQLRWVGGLFVGLVIGLFVGVGYVLFAAPVAFAAGRPVDTVNWSWPDAQRGLFSGLGVGLGFGLVFGPVLGWVFGLLLALVGGLLLALVAGLVTDSVSQRSAANGGLKQSALYAARYLLFLLIPACGFALLAAPLDRDVHVAMWWIGAGISSCGMTVALNKGGAFCIHNLLLRYLLARAGYTPWRYTTFLHHAVDRVIMIRQGGSFRFLHRMIQEHLAAAASARASQSSPGQSSAR